MKTQIIIPVAEKNINMVIKNIFYINIYLKPDSIYILTASKNIPKLALLSNETITILDEDTIYPDLTFASIKKKLSELHFHEEATGWYFQQFLKMTWCKTKYCNEYYTTWDADTFPLHNFSLFNAEGKPLFQPKSEYNKAYFNTINLLTGYTKKADYSFISEKMTFKKSYMNELMELIERSTINGNNLFEKILYAASLSGEKSAFSEFETYGTYLLYNHPESFELKKLNSFRNAAAWFGTSPNKYDIAFLSHFYDTASFEEWTKQKKVFIPFLKTLAFLLYQWRKRSHEKHIH